MTDRAENSINCYSHCVPLHTFNTSVPMLAFVYLVDIIASDTI